jgi:hypothetical protein
MDARRFSEYSESVDGIAKGAESFRNCNISRHGNAGGSSSKSPGSGDF